MILSFRLFQSDIVTHPNAGAYKRRTGCLHSEEWAYSDATGVCHFWYLSAWAALINSLIVSILPSQQRFNRRLRPEPPVAMIGVGIRGCGATLAAFKNQVFRRICLSHSCQRVTAFIRMAGNDLQAPLAWRGRGVILALGSVAQQTRHAAVL